MRDRMRRGQGPTGQLQDEEGLEDMRAKERELANRIERCVLYCCRILGGGVVLCMPDSVSFCFDATLHTCMHPTTTSIPSPPHLLIHTYIHTCILHTNKQGLPILPHVHLPKMGLRRRAVPVRLPPPLQQPCLALVVLAPGLVAVCTYTYMSACMFILTFHRHTTQNQQQP